MTSGPGQPHSAQGQTAQPHHSLYLYLLCLLCQDTQAAAVPVVVAGCVAVAAAAPDAVVAVAPALIDAAAAVVCLFRCRDLNTFDC